MGQLDRDSGLWEFKQFKYVITQYQLDLPSQFVKEVFELFCNPTEFYSYGEKKKQESKRQYRGNYNKNHDDVIYLDYFKKIIDVDPDEMVP